MLMYGWMKFVEIAPERYDWAVELMTAGRLGRIKDRIAGTINPGERVLDVGCGTGTLAVRCLRRGAHVTGLDSSAFMLAEARRNADDAGFGKGLVLVKDSVTQLRKHFAEESFDVVLSTMALGEFPREYLQYILTDCRRVLRPGGRLLIADEVWPERPLPLLLYRIGMFLLWVPQFLLLRRVFFPIRDLPGVLRASGFSVQRLEHFAYSSFKLAFCLKPSVADAIGIPGLADGVPGTAGSVLSAAKP